jgi:SAM-dependent methyltransferase
VVAAKFLSWLAVPPSGRWLDVGAGTGALSESILASASPKSVRGIDASDQFVAFLRGRVVDPRITFQVEDAQSLPEKDNSYEAVVSGLVLNFLPDPRLAVREMARVTRLGGVVAAYVWDYAERMQFMRHFWNAVTALDPGAAGLDEGKRFPLCSPDALSRLFLEAGLGEVVVEPIDIWTVFGDFEDFWSPFLGGQGPGPSYVMSLTEEGRNVLRDRIRAGLPFAVDGSIPLIARAWAVRGRSSGGLA